MYYPTAVTSWSDYVVRFCSFRRTTVSDYTNRNYTLCCTKTKLRVTKRLARLGFRFPWGLFWTDCSTTWHRKLCRHFYLSIYTSARSCFTARYRANTGQDFSYKRGGLGNTLRKASKKSLNQLRSTILTDWLHWTPELDSATTNQRLRASTVPQLADTLSCWGARGRLHSLSAAESPSLRSRRRFAANNLALTDGVTHQHNRSK